VTTNREVDDWFSSLDHPLKSTMQRVREIILAADPRITELVKYGTVSFVCANPMASFVQVKDKRQVSLMFNAAGRLKGDFPHLEGKSVKYLRFKDESEASTRAAELAAITCAWCDQDTPRPKRST
jgi:Domain of unknown function (DU1801)